MLRILLLFTAAAAALAAADDPWAKVRDIKTGADLRVFKTGAAAPLLANMAEATEENLIVIVKNQQLAIARNQIERIDHRPARSGSRFKTETKTTQEDPTTKPSRPGYRGSPARPSSTSGTFGVASRPGFETIYRRPPPIPQK